MNAQREHAAPKSSGPILSQVAAIHGAAGPFAVAGYRMGEAALERLHVSRGSFSIEVVHKTPFEVQWSCIADGVQAATGVSAGKLNLKLVQVSSDQTETVIRNRASGESLVFRLQSSFLKRYRNLPPERLEAAGREIANLPESEIFNVRDSKEPSTQ